MRHICEELALDPCCFLTLSESIDLRCNRGGLGFFFRLFNGSDSGGQREGEQEHPKCDANLKSVSGDESSGYNLEVSQNDSECAK